MTKEMLALLMTVGFGAGCTQEMVESNGVERVTGALDSCPTVTGLMPAKASLAVAMAAEMHAWKPLEYLQKPATSCQEGGQVTLSAAGEAICDVHGGCPVTHALLALQDSRVNETIDQNEFNATNYRCDLYYSFERQQNLLTHIRNNYPAYAPPASYTLTSKGTLNLGGCANHYGFDADVSGQALANLQFDLCFFGQDASQPVGYGCGGNPWIDFRAGNVVDLNDPTRTAMVAIDPVTGDGTGTPTSETPICNLFTTSRLYDPGDRYLGKCCTYEASSGVMVMGTVRNVSGSTTWNACVKTVY